MEFIEDWKDGILTKTQLENKYQCPYDAMKTRARVLHVERNSKIKQINHLNVISDWMNSNYTNEDICKKYNFSDDTLHKILHIYNLGSLLNRKRKYHFNEKYFDDISNEHKAYWLGFIYADGCHREERNSLSITLQENDEKLLQKFYEDIECDKPIRKYYNKIVDKYYTSIYVQHPHLSKTLLKQGVTNNKSFKIKFPSDEIVPNDLKRHFIRGYFDGNGCIYVPKNRSKMRWSIVSNFDFINEMKNYIESNIPNYKINMHQIENVYEISKGGRFVTQIFLDWLYKDSTVYIQRKYDKYLEVLEYNRKNGCEQSK